MRAILVVVLSAIFMAPAAAGDLASLKGPAADEIRDSLKHFDIECPSDPDKKCPEADSVLDAKLLYGHFPASDDDDRTIAAVFLYEDTGGSGSALVVQVWVAHPGDKFGWLGTTKDAIGEDARNVRFLKNGIIEYTGTVMRAGDTHAAPSGKQKFRILVRDGSVTFLKK